MINWNQFTVDNGAITDLQELLFLRCTTIPTSILRSRTKPCNKR